MSRVIECLSYFMTGLFMLCYVRISFPFLRPNSALLYESATFIHDGHLGPLHLLVIVKSAALTTGVQVSVRAPTLSSFGSVPRGGVAGSWG